MKIYPLILNHINNHKKLIMVAIILGTVFCLSELRNLKLNTSLHHMVPDDRLIQNQLEFLEARSKKYDIIVQLEINDPSSDKSHLFKAIDQLHDKLTLLKLHKIHSRFFSSGAIEFKALLNYLPVLFTTEYNKIISDQTHPSYINQTLDEHLHRIKTGAGFFFKNFLLTDPLNLSTTTLKYLQQLLNNIQFRGKLEDGYLLSEDEKKALILIESENEPVSLKMKALTFKKIRDILNEMPPNIKGIVISPHFHSIWNEKILKTDIRYSMVAVSIILLLLLIFIFKDTKAIIVFITPMISLLIAVILLKIIFKDISAIAIGFGSVIAGISIDYGIHMFSALKNDFSKNTSETFYRIKKPLIISAGTTISAFTVFIFSNISSFKQIALLTNISLLLCFLFTVLILPLFIKNKKHSDKVYTTPLIKIRSSKFLLLLWAVLNCFFLFFMLQTILKTDLKSYDGTPKAILADEEEFLKTWQKSDSSVIIIKGENLEDALIKNDWLYSQFQNFGISDTLNSLSPIYPALRNKTSNLKRWETFFNANKKNIFDELYKTSVQKGFSKDAFSTCYKDFKSSVLTPPPNSIKALTSNFIFNSPLNTFIINPLSDFKILPLKLKEKIQISPDIFFFEKNEFFNQITQSTQKEILMLSLIALFFSVTILFLLLRDIKSILISLLPAITSILWISGGLTFLKSPLTPLHFLSLIIVIGLCIDYGVFIFFHFMGSHDKGIFKGVILSGLTTISGALMLSFTKHPVLNTLGSTIFAGISIGLITAIVIIPSCISLGCLNKKAINK